VVGGREGSHGQETSCLDSLYFGVLLLLAFSNSPYVKVFDLFDGPCVLVFRSSLSRWRHRRDAARNKSGTAAPQDAADHFLSYRGALVPRRFEALKVNSTPVLGTGRCPCGPERLEPPAFGRPLDIASARAGGHQNFGSGNYYATNAGCLCCSAKSALLVPQIPAIFRAAGRFETPGKRSVAPAFLLG
jgi:hypothetical protein